MRLINNVTNTTSEVLMNCNVSDDLGKISTPMDEDSLKILSEVEELLEQETKSKLPEVPQGIAVAKR